MGDFYLTGGNASDIDAYLIKAGPDFVTPPALPGASDRVLMTRMTSGLLSADIVVGFGGSILAPVIGAASIQGGTASARSAPEGLEASGSAIVTIEDAILNFVRASDARVTAGSVEGAVGAGSGGRITILSAYTGASITANGGGRVTVNGGIDAAFVGTSGAGSLIIADSLEGVGVPAMFCRLEGGELRVGDYHVSAPAGQFNDLEILEGAIATITGQLGLGRLDGDRDSITISGEGSVLAYSKTLLAGVAGQAVLDVLDKAEQVLSGLVLGQQATGTAYVTVASGALLEVRGSGAAALDVGPKGTGQVQVRGEGSDLWASSMRLGGAVVDDSLPDDRICGEWIYTGGSGNLEITDGGSVTVDTTLTLRGHDATTPIILVSGGSDLTIGGIDSGPGDHIDIHAGGTLTGHGLVVVGDPLGDGWSGILHNDGKIVAKDGILRLDANIEGSGEAHIAELATLELGGRFDGNVVFDSRTRGTLKLDDPDPKIGFTGTIGSLRAGDTISFDLEDLPKAVIAHAEIRDESLVLLFRNGREWTYQLDGAYAGGTFTTKLASDDGSGLETGLDLTFQQNSARIRTGVNGDPTGNPYVDALLWGEGAWQRGTTITYSFGTRAAQKEAVHKHGQTHLLDCDTRVFAWSGEQKDTYRAALDAFAEVSGLKFREISSASDANIVPWLMRMPKTDPNATTLGESEVPAQMADGHLWQYFNVAATSFAHLGAGGSGRRTMVHEIGHALGLAHPFDGGSEPDHSAFPTVPDNQDQAVFTTMSYTNGWQGAGGKPPHAYGDQAKLGALDIAAIQFLYGTKKNASGGDTIYTLPGENAKGTAWSCIWDTGGVDEIRAPKGAVNTVINLFAATLGAPDAGGFVSWVKGVKGGFTIANALKEENAVAIENATGAAGNDRITGNDHRNELAGLFGDDVLRGRAAADRILGGGGDDILDGDKGNDRLDGGTGDDRMTGGGAADLFAFGLGSGADTIADFENGTDRLLVERRFAGSLAEVKALAQDVGGDLVIDNGRGDVLTIRNLSLAGLTHDDLVFA